MTRVKAYAPWLIALLAILYLWYDHTHPKVIYQKEMVEVPVHKEILRVKTVQLACVNVVAYDKDKASENLDVPDTVKADESKQITAAGEIGPYEGTTTVTAVFDTGTGRTSLLSRREPLPFFSLMNDKEVGIRYGYTSDSIGFDLYGKLTFLRIGRVHTALYVESNSRSDAKAMLQAGYRF